MNSSYVNWLKERGELLYKTGDTHWQWYKNALIPARIGPCFVNLHREEAKGLLQESRAWFLRYSSDPVQEESEWWYVICDAYDVTRLSANTRSKINRGKRKCVVRPLEPGWLAEHGYPCYKSAHTRYKNARASSQERFRSNIRKTTGGPFEYWGVFVGDCLSGYCQCIIEGNRVATNVIKFDPANLRHYTSYALMSALADYYVNGQSRIISNGTRPIAHDTNMQDFLVKLGFRRQYCRLNVIYQPWLAVGTRAVFPFRRAVAALPDNGVLHKLRVFLFQEELNRLCK